MQTISLSRRFTVSVEDLHLYYYSLESLNIVSIITRLESPSIVTIMDKLRQVYQRNQYRFPLFHLHLTFTSEEYAIESGLRYTKIILPYSATSFYTQILSTEKITKLNDYLLLERDYAGVIGWKLEGIRHRQPDENLEDFCYAEYHEKADNLEELMRKTGSSDNDVTYLSFSAKNNKFLSARRDTHMLNYTGGEVCLFDYWEENIEAPWKASVPTHYSDLLSIFRNNFLT